MHKSISIIIPCYNHGKYLPDCIESILSQSLKADEIIVVDDGSTEDIAQVIADHFYPHPIGYIRQENKGLAGARNTGIRNAKSEYIMVLDADDMLRPDSLKEMMQLAEPDKVVQAGLMYFGTQNAVLRPEPTNLNRLLKGNTVYCNSVFPRKAWVESGGYDESEIMRLGLEDWDFWIRVAEKGYGFVSTSYIALLYRRTADSMTFQTTHPNFEKITKYIMHKHKHLLDKP